MSWLGVIAASHHRSLSWDRAWPYVAVVGEFAVWRIRLSGAKLYPVRGLIAREGWNCSMISETGSANRVQRSLQVRRRHTGAAYSAGASN